MPPADWIAPLIYALLLLRLTVEGGLVLLNLRHTARHGAQVPPQLAGHIPPERAVRARDYTLARGRLGLAGLLVDNALLAAVLFSGFLPWLDGWLRGWGLAGAHLFVAYLVALQALFSLVGLPLRLYGTFAIEARFGFNRLTWRLWLADAGKGLALAALLGLPLLYGIHAFMAATGEAWWLWVFALLVAFQLVLVWLYPLLIAPLFNRFRPLEAGELRTALLALAEKAGFRPGGLFVVDASRRSGHSNAYFTGLWRPRIVLFDTLLREMPTGEALAVLAHEIGHFRLHHVLKGLLRSLAVLLVTLWALSLLLPWAPLYAAFGFAGPSFHAALALATLCGGLFTFPAGPVSRRISRAHEYAADRYARTLTGGGAPLSAALLRLHGDNLSNLAPHPWYAAWHYSHPPLQDRLRALA